MSRPYRSPSGWVDPMTPADWALWRANSDAIRMRAQQREVEAPTSPPASPGPAAMPVSEPVAISRHPGAGRAVARQRDRIQPSFRGGRRGTR